jgi:riboflavin kinase/FMN adenylyltransferase
MKIIHDPAAFDRSGAAVSIGMFDGVHRGHRRVLHSLRQQGVALRLPTVLLTFDPHPRAVLRPASCPALLSTLPGRMRLLAATGDVDYCLVLDFDRRRSSETADEFVARTLVDMLGMRALVVGQNFACGKGRQGDIAYLRGLGARLGFELFPVPLRADGQPDSAVACSSSETRRLIQRGDIAGANAMLDRPHELSGTVSGPDGAARRVIELAVPGNLCCPPAGEYAGTVKRRDAAASWIGAVLQVREHDGRDPARTLRLLVEQDAGIACGEALSVRFLGRAAGLRMM